MSATERLAKACARVPFANGTEGDAWMSKWCAYCTHDHEQHPGGSGDGGCMVLSHAYFPEDFPWPEAWLPEPDDGRSFLPSRLICSMFEPCTQGACCGDPGAADRADRVAEVQGFWAAASRVEDTQGEQA
jgi:hypothetical protein